MKSEQLCELVIDALEEVKARDIVKLDVRELTTVTDYMIVASLVSKVKTAANGCSWTCRMCWCT
jgi:ribosome-associated protein